MSLVHVLDDNTINKIAAGEVVERPASVVKELVENAIDAHADRIEVEIAAGGTSFIRVTDNGIGMSEPDAKLAILRHATSKITQVGDLQDIDTLGFRGEALPSIAAVSRFSLQTRQAGAELGTEIKISGGKDMTVNPVGCGIGTTIKVEDLFFNTPARKKFLKTNNTESGKINDFIIKLALSNPQIAFKFINNNKMAVTTPGNDNLHDAIRSIYGSTVGSALLGVDFEDSADEIQIKGYVTKPSSIRSSRTWQTCIVNGRIISSRAIAKAIDNAYHSLLPKAGFPLAVLLISVPQNTIDVNVHPQKSEIKFEDEGRIFKAVYKAVLDAVRPAGRALGNLAASVENPEKHAAVAGMGVKKIQPAVSEPLFRAGDFADAKQSNYADASHFGGAEGSDVIGMTSGSIGYFKGRTSNNYGNYDGYGDKNSQVNFDSNHHNGLGNMSEGSGVQEQGYGGYSNNEADANQSVATEESSQYSNVENKYNNANAGNVHDNEENQYHNIGNTCNNAENTKGLNGNNNPEMVPGQQDCGSNHTAQMKLKPIGQVNKCYIIAQDGDSLYIVDQHAAHERILYDHFAAQADRIPSQQLLVHLMLNFSQEEAELIDLHLDTFEQLGFELSPSGPNQFRMAAAPADIPVGEAENVIREVLAGIDAMHTPTAAELRHACLAVTACKAAIKAGFELNYRQMEMLLEELQGTTLPYTCPHGRPTILKFTSGELDKMFKRTGF